MENVLKKQENYLKLIVDNTAEGVEVQKIDSSKKTTLASIDKNITDLHLTVYEQLDSVIENLKSINDSIIESFIAIDDIKKSLIPVINPLVQKPEASQNTSRVNQGLSDEEKTEAVRREETLVKEQTAQTDLLKKILDALSPTTKKDTPETPGTGIIGTIGVIGTGLAIALGAVTGYIKGYLKILRAIGRELYKALDNLSGGRISKALDAFSTKLVTLIDDFYLFMSRQFIRIQKFFSGFGLRIMTLFDDILLSLPKSIGTPLINAFAKIENLIKAIPTNVGKFFDDIVGLFKNINLRSILPNLSGAAAEEVAKQIKTVFNFDFLSKIDDLFKVLSEVSKPFNSTIKFVKDSFTKISTFFGSIKSYFDDFFKIFGKVVPIFEKLAVPLTVIMAIWDTVKGAIEGFEKEGIVGAIKGAITGLFNSLIGGFADLVKDIISWVAGALGFKSVEKALDSFSFQDIFKKVVDSVFGFFGSIIDWITNPFENFSLGAIFGTMPDLLKGAISWVAGKLGFTELEKLLDSFSLTDIFNDAVKAIFGFMSSIGDWVSNKINAVKNFLGFGDTKEKAKERLVSAQRHLSDTKTAYTMGALGINEQGQVRAATTLVNGSPDREASRRRLQSRGYREMSEDEKKAYLNERVAAVMKAGKDLEAIEDAPTISKTLDSLKESVLGFFGSIIDRIKKVFDNFSVGAIFGTIPDLLKGVISWVAGKLGFSELEKFLDSFSLTDIFNDAVKAIFGFMSSIIDWIKKVFDNFSLGAIFGTIPDLLKRVISWVAGKLGFTELEKLLDSFSVTDIFNDAVKAIFGFMSSISDWITNKINSVKNFLGFGSKEEKNVKEVKDVFTKTTGDRVAAADAIKKFKEENGAPDVSALSPDLEVTGRYTSLTGFDWKGNERSWGSMPIASYKDERKQKEYAKLLQQQYTAESMQGSALEEYGIRKDDLKHLNDGERRRLNNLRTTSSFQKAGLTTTIENSKKMIAALTERGGVEAGTIEVPDNKEQYDKLLKQYAEMNYKALQEASEDGPTLSKTLDSAKESVSGFFGGIFDKAKEMWDSVDIKGAFESVSDFSGGIFDKAKEMWDSVDIKGAFESVSGIANEYIIDPVKSLFEKITNLIEEYITKPLQTFFTPLVNFFKMIPTKLASIFEYVGIPEIKYTIPVINKDISIGPFYPFRPKEDEYIVGGNMEYSQSSGKKGGQSIFTHDMSSVGKKTTDILQNKELSSETPDGKTQASLNQLFASFDTKTGKSRISASGEEIEKQLSALGIKLGSDYDAEISNRAFDNIKLSSQKGKGSIEASLDILKEDLAYQKLSWFDKRKVDIGYANALELIKDDKYKSVIPATVAPNRELNANVYDRSVRNEGMKAAATGQTAPVIVSAATTNIANNKQNVTLPVPTRNQDPSVQGYIAKKNVLI